MTACADSDVLRATNPALREMISRGLARHGRLPLQGNFELTLQCNLRCDHCYLGADRQRAELSTDEALRILDEMAAAGVLLLTLTGGEVLLRRDFDVIYRRAHELGFLVSVFTNGLLIEDQHVELWRRAPPRMIEVSLYGLDDVTYSKFTRRPVRFATLDAKLRALVAAGLPLTLKAVATRTLASQIDALKAYADSLGVHFYFATVVHGAHDATPLADAERPAPQRVAELEFGDATRALMQTRDVSAPRRQDDKVLSCGAGRVAFHVDPEGELSRCGMLAGPVAAKVSLRSTSFAQAWSRMGAGLDATLPTDHPCRACEIRHLCNRCAATSSDEAQTAMCELAHTRARHLGYVVASVAPMVNYLRQQSAGAPILQRRYRG